MFHGHGLAGFSPDGFNIGKILLSSDGFLVPDKFRTPKNVNRDTPIGCHDAPGGGFFPLHSGKRRDQVDSNRRNAELNLHRYPCRRCNGELREERVRIPRR